MKKILIILCLLLLTGCSPKTLEERMQGQWVVVETTAIIVGDDDYYTELYSKRNLETNELVKYEKKNKDDEYTKIEANEGEIFLSIIEFTKSQKLFSSEFTDFKAVFDIEYFDNSIGYSYNASESEMPEKLETPLDGIISITFDDDKMITETVSEVAGFTVTTKSVLVKLNN